MPDCFYADLAAAPFRNHERSTSAVLGTSLSKPRPFRHPYKESAAFDPVKGRRVDHRGSIRPGEITYFDEGKAARVSPDERDIVVIDGIPYYEFPNSTGFTIKTKDGRRREFMITRGIRKYVNIIRPSEGIFNAPQNYVSDLLISERVNGVMTPKRIFMKSDPEKRFFFEDPRISTLFDSEGNLERLICSGTDYSNHAPGSNDLFVMNRAFEIPFDRETGEVGAIEVDTATSRPKLFNLSPPPQRDGSKWVGTDAKNGLIDQRETDKRIVVRTRFRPDFASDPTVLRYRKLYGERVPDWAYAEQVFVFDSLAQLKSYDWSHSMDDLLSKHLGVTPLNATKRIRPYEAKITATDKDIPDHYPPELLVEGKPLGFGPGSRKFQVWREGLDIFVAEGPYAPKEYAGTLASEAEAKLIEKTLGLTDKGHIPLAYDHKLRYLKQATIEDPSIFVIKRVYSGSITVWDPSHTDVVRRYDDVIQPIQLGQIANSGILDLQHAGYTQGGVVVVAGVSEMQEREAAGTSLPGRPLHFIRSIGGAADAHTESYDWNIIKLLRELVDPAREPQAYTPAKVGTY